MPRSNVVCAYVAESCRVDCKICNVFHILAIHSLQQQISRSACLEELCGCFPNIQKETTQDPHFGERNNFCIKVVHKNDL